MSEKNIPHEIVGVLMRFVNLQSFWSNAAIRKPEIDFEDFMVLNLIKDCGKVTLAAFSKLLGLRLSSITVRVEKLKRLELITTSQDDEDRRAQSVKLTENARELIPKIYEYFKLTTAIQSLSKEDQASLLALFQKLDQSIQFDFDETFGKIPFAGIGFFGF